MIRLLLIFFLILSYSCEQKLNSTTDVVNWYSENDEIFSKIKKIGNKQFTVKWRPKEMMILNELDDKQNRDSLLLSYGQRSYFVLEIGLQNEIDLMKKEAIDYSDYSDKVKFLSFHLKEYLSIQVGDKIYSPELCHYERAFDLGTPERFIVSFPIDESQLSIGTTFIYNDPLFKAGKLKYNFNSDLIPPVVKYAS